MKRKNNGFSETQVKLYWDLVPQAWNCFAERTGGDQFDADAMDDWRREVNLIETSFENIEEMNMVEDFDNVMLSLATEANHKRWMHKLSRAAEDRHLFVLRRFLNDLSFLLGKPVGWSYVRGIAKQMHLPLTVEECPAAMLGDSLKILDTHIRKVAERQGKTIKDLPAYTLRRPGKVPSKPTMQQQTLF